MNADGRGQGKNQIPSAFIRVHLRLIRPFFGAGHRAHSPRAVRPGGDPARPAGPNPRRAPNLPIVVLSPSVRWKSPVFLRFVFVFPCVARYSVLSPNSAQSGWRGNSVRHFLEGDSSRANCYGASSMRTWEWRQQRWRTIDQQPWQNRRFSPQPPTASRWQSAPAIAVADPSA